MTNTIRFKRPLPDGFYRTVSKRVNDYFRTTGKSKFADYRMYLKTATMLLLYWAPYLLIVTGAVTGNIWLLTLCIVMGFGLSGIGLSVMHDANHGSYFKNKRLNHILGYIMNVVGGCATTWKIQHNHLHHTYTNIDHHDDDIAVKGIIRLCPHSPYKKIFRYQHIYAWLLYCLQTLIWIVFGDVKQLIDYRKRGLLKELNYHFGWEMFSLVMTKLLYIGYALILPYFLLDLAFYQVLTGFLIVHFIAGLFLALVFQSAHVVEDTEFPLPDDTGNIKNQWAVHQMYTTANFAQANRFLTWFVGGLNYQVEHHLFPHISHIHYRDISKVIKQTASEFNLPYLSKKTFWQAIVSHGRMLKRLGEAT
jgi:linoleoyl-CoA desaturase